MQRLAGTNYALHHSWSARFPIPYPTGCSPGMLIAFCLMFIARPLAVFVSLIPYRYSLREKIYISWVGLRGAVPIVLATFPLVAGMKVPT